MKPGVHTITAAAYHADPCEQPSLSSSIAKLLVNQTPLHAWTAHPRLNPAQAERHEAQFDIGSAAHAMMLNDDRPFVVIDADDYRTKAAQEQRFLARSEGKIPLLADQFIRVKQMVHAGRIQLARHAEAATAFTDGEPEQTLIWEEEGVMCRARPDWMPHASLRIGGRTFWDYKTLDCADPSSLPGYALRMGFDIQAAFYCRGLRALDICDRPEFRFVCQERDPPFALSVIGLAPDFVDLAEHKVERAVHIWRDCLRTNIWPAYPDRVCWIEAPAYAESQFMARDERMDDASRKLFRVAEQGFAP